MVQPVRLVQPVCLAQPARLAQQSKGELPPIRLILLPFRLIVNCGPALCGGSQQTYLTQGPFCPMTSFRRLLAWELDGRLLCASGFSPGLTQPYWLPVAVVSSCCLHSLRSNLVPTTWLMQPTTPNLAPTSALVHHAMRTTAVACVRPNILQTIPNYETN